MPLTPMGLRRTTALFLIITFLTTSLSPSLYAQSSKGALRTQDSHSLATRPQALAALSLPSEMGKIEEHFSGQEDRLVILIQDAHSAGEAQKSMRRIIEFYEKQGVRLVTAEGAAGKMDTELFRAFPDRDKLERTFDFYLSKGELSGAAASAALTPFPSDYYGIEDKKLYHEGVSLFLKALSEQPAALKKLEARKHKVEALKKKHYSKKLLEVDRALEEFSETHQNLEGTLKTLVKIGQGTGKAALPVPSSLKLILEEITSDKGRWTKDDAKLEKKFAAIQGGKFQEEFDTYSEAVRQSLFRDDAEQKIHAQAEKLRSIEHLIQLKLTRKEWAFLSSPHAFKRGSSIMNNFPAHFSFYCNAESREEFFQKNLSRLMGQHKVAAAVFVAGGFHSSAMAHHLKESGISYLLISPAIKELPEEGLYLEHMRGEISWKKHFQIKNGRIDLFESFTKAAMERLLNQTPSAKSQETERDLGAWNLAHGAVLKKWRDQLIRNLVANENAASANRYTRFLDEAAVQLMDPSKKSELQGEWLTKVDQFLTGLRNLKEKNQLTPQNIVNLTSVPGKFNVVPLEAVGAVVPGSYRMLESARSEVRSAEVEQAVMKALKEWKESPDVQVRVKAAEEIADKAPLLFKGRPELISEIDRALYDPLLGIPNEFIDQAVTKAFIKLIPEFDRYHQRPEDSILALLYAFLEEEGRYSAPVHLLAGEGLLRILNEHVLSAEMMHYFKEEIQKKASLELDERQSVAQMIAYLKDVQEQTVLAASLLDQPFSIEQMAAAIKVAQEHNQGNTNPTDPGSGKAVLGFLYKQNGDLFDNHEKTLAILNRAYIFALNRRSETRAVDKDWVTKMMRKLDSAGGSSILLPDFRTKFQDLKKIANVPGTVDETRLKQALEALIQVFNDRAALVNTYPEVGNALRTVIGDWPVSRDAHKPPLRDPVQKGKTDVQTPKADNKKGVEKKKDTKKEKKKTKWEDWTIPTPDGSLMEAEGVAARALAFYLLTWNEFDAWQTKTKTGKNKFLTTFKFITARDDQEYLLEALQTSEEEITRRSQQLKGEIEKQEKVTADHFARAYILFSEAVKNLQSDSSLPPLDKDEFFAILYLLQTPAGRQMEIKEALRPRIGAFLDYWEALSRQHVENLDWRAKISEEYGPAIKQILSLLGVSRSEVRMRGWIAASLLVFSLAGLISPSFNELWSQEQKTPAAKVIPEQESLNRVLAKEYPDVEFVFFVPGKMDPEIEKIIAGHIRKAFDKAKQINPAILWNPRAGAGNPSSLRVTYEGGPAKQEVAFYFQNGWRDEEDPSEEKKFSTQQLKTDQDVWRKILISMLRYQDLTPQQKDIWRKLVKTEYEKASFISQIKAIWNGEKKELVTEKTLKGEFRDYAVNYEGNMDFDNARPSLERFLKLYIETGNVPAEEFEETNWLLWTSVGLGAVTAAGVWWAIKRYRKSPAPPAARSEARSIDEEFQKLTVMANAAGMNLGGAVYVLVHNIHRVSENEAFPQLQEIKDDITDVQHQYFTLLNPEHLSQVRYEEFSEALNKLLTIKDRLSRVDAETQKIFGSEFSTVRDNIFDAVRTVSEMLDKIQWPQNGWPQSSEEDFQAPGRLSDLQYVNLVSEVNHHYEELQKAARDQEHMEIQLVYLDSEQWDLAGQTSGPDFETLREEIAKTQLVFGRPAFRDIDDLGVEAADWIQSNVSGKTIRVRRLQDKEFNDIFYIILIGKPAGIGSSISEFLPNPSHFPSFWRQYGNYLLALGFILAGAAFFLGPTIRESLSRKNIPAQKKEEPERHLAPRSEARANNSFAKVSRGLAKERLTIYKQQTHWDPAIAVFVSARYPKDHPYYALGVETGRAIARRDVSVRFGAGPGGMAAVAEGADQERRRSKRKIQIQGVRIQLPFEQRTDKRADPGVTYYEYFMTRKLGLHQNTLGAIILPGGVGTTDELFEVWRRERPFALIGKSFWQPIVDSLLEKWEEAGFDMKKPFVTDSPDEAVNFILKHTVPDAHRSTLEQIKKANEELENGFRFIADHTPRHQKTIVFVGKPLHGKSIPETETAVYLADVLARQYSAKIRVASRGALFERILKKSRREGWERHLEGVFYVPENTGLTHGEHSLEADRRLILHDASNQQVLLTVNADALVFFPGSPGTWNKLFDVLQIYQTRKAVRKPIILVGKFWEPMNELLDTMLDNPGEIEMISPKDRDLIRFVETPEQIPEAFQDIFPQMQSGKKIRRQPEVRTAPSVPALPYLTGRKLGSVIHDGLKDRRHFDLIPYIQWSLYGFTEIGDAIVEAFERGELSLTELDKKQLKYVVRDYLGQYLDEDIHVGKNLFTKPIVEIVAEWAAVHGASYTLRPPKRTRSEVRAADKNFDPEKRKDVEVILVMKERAARTAYFKYLVDRGYTPGNIRFENVSDVLEILKTSEVPKHLLIIQTELADDGFEAAWKKILVKKPVRLKAHAKLKKQQDLKAPPQLEEEQKLHTAFNQQVEPALAKNFPDLFAKSDKAPYDKEKVQAAIDYLLKLIPQEDAYQEARSVLTWLSSQLSNKQLEAGLVERLYREVIENESDWLKILEDTHGWHLIADRTTELQNALRLLAKTFPLSQQGGAVSLETFYRNAFDLLEALRDLGGADLDVTAALDSVTELQSSALNFSQQVQEIKKRFLAEHKTDLRELAAADGLLYSRRDIVQNFLSQLERLTKPRSEMRAIEHKNFMDLAKLLRPTETSTTAERNLQTLIMRALDHFSIDDFNEAIRLLQNLHVRLKAISLAHPALANIQNMLDELHELQKVKEKKKAETPAAKPETPKVVETKPTHTPDPQLAELRSLLHLESGLFQIQTKKPDPKKAEEKKKPEASQKSEEEMSIKEKRAAKKEKADEAAAKAKLQIPESKPRDPAIDAQRIIDEAMLLDDAQALAMKLAELRKLPFNTHYQKGMEALRLTTHLHEKYLQKMMDEKTKAPVETTQEPVKSPAPSSPVTFQQLYDLITTSPDVFELTEEGRRSREEVPLILKRVLSNPDAVLIQQALDLLRKPFALGRAKTPNANKASEMLKKLREQASAPAPAPAKPVETAPAVNAGSASLTNEQKRWVVRVVEEALLKQINTKWQKNYSADAFDTILKVEVEVLPPEAPETDRIFKIGIIGADHSIEGIMIHAAKSRPIWFLFDRITPSSEKEIRDINADLIGFGPRLFQLYQEARSEVRKAREKADQPLLFGVHEMRPDWLIMRALGTALLVVLKKNAGKAAAEEEVFRSARALLEGYGFEGEDVQDEKFQQLMLRIQNELKAVQKTAKGWTLAAGVDPRRFATQVSAVDYVLDEILEFLQKPDKNSKDFYQMMEDYAAASEYWQLYQTEARWPVEKAAALLLKKDQKILLDLLNKASEKLQKRALVDSLQRMLSSEKPEKWLEKHAPNLIGSTIYYISPETWLAAGGLGRVGQYHTIKIKELLGDAADLATIESYYWEPDPAEPAKMRPVNYEGVPMPIRNLTLFTTYEIRVSKKGQRVPVIVEVYKGTNDYGMEVYMIRDVPETEGKPYFIRQLYKYTDRNKYDQMVPADAEMAARSEYIEFMSKASVKLVKKLEKIKQEKLKTQEKEYVPAVLWSNDAQTIPVSMFKRISDWFDELELTDEQKQKIIETEKPKLSEVFAGDPDKIKKMERIFEEKDPARLEKLLAELKDLISAKDEADLSNSIAHSTTHTYRNRAWENFEVLSREWVLPQRVDPYLRSAVWPDQADPTRLLNMADSGNGVAAVHAQEMGPHHHPEIALFGIANGDLLQKTEERLVQAAEQVKTEHPEFTAVDLDDPPPAFVPLVKRKSKELWMENLGNFLQEKIKKTKDAKERERLEKDLAVLNQIDPGKMVNSYSGRGVEEKVDIHRVFTLKNLKSWASLGAQVVIYANVQPTKESRELFEALKRSQDEVNEEASKKGNEHWGRVLVVTGWGPHEQRYLFAATDASIYVSERSPHKEKWGTEAAGRTEANYGRVYAMNITAPFIEGLFTVEGAVRNRHKPGSGNIIITQRHEEFDYRRTVGGLIQDWNLAFRGEGTPEDLTHYAADLAAGRRLTQVFDAGQPGAQYLRTFDEAMGAERNPLTTLERFLAGETPGLFYRNERVREKLIKALNKNGIAKFSRDPDPRAHMFVAELQGTPHFVAAAEGALQKGQKVFARIRNDKTQRLKKLLLEQLKFSLQDRVEILDAVTGESLGIHQVDYLLSPHLYNVPFALSGEAPVRIFTFKRVTAGKHLPPGRGPSEVLSEAGYSLELAKKIFDPNANSFGWYKDFNGFIAQSDPGAAGFIESFLRLRAEDPSRTELSLLHHAAGDDVLTYLLYLFEELPDAASAVREELQRFAELANENDDLDFKIRLTLQAMELVDRYLQKIAARVFEDYWNTAPEDLYQDPKTPTELGKKYQELFYNTQLAKRAVRYLSEEHPAAKAGRANKQGIRTFMLEDGGERRLVLLNAGEVSYPDADKIQKAWGNMLYEGEFQEMMDSLLPDDSYVIRPYDSKSGEKFKKFYFKKQIQKNELPVGVPGIQILGFEVLYHEGLRDPQIPETNPWNRIRDRVQAIRLAAEKKDTKELRRLLPPQKEIAALIYTRELLPAVMQLVAGLAPGMLQEIKGWDPELFPALSKILRVNREVMEKGTLRFAQPRAEEGDNGAITFSYSLNHGRDGQNIVFHIDFDHQISRTDGKAWSTVRKLMSPEGLNLKDDALYFIHDLIENVQYNSKTGAHLRRHWDIGVPIRKISLNGKAIQRPYSGGIYQLRPAFKKDFPTPSVKPSRRKTQPAHEMQVFEFNTRAYFEEIGIKSWDEFTSEKIQEIKDLGFNTFWPMGIYEESEASRELNEYWGKHDNLPGRAASAFAVPDYIVSFGGPEKFKAFAKRAKKLGVRVVVDFIPNHVAMDSPLIAEHPDWFIHRTTPPEVNFENGQKELNLNDTNESFLTKFEKDYFKYQLPDGRLIWVAHGRDGGPWGDTAQFNLLNPEVWQYFKKTLFKQAEWTDGGGVRADSLQVLLPEEYRRRWFPFMQMSDFGNHMHAISQLVFEQEPREGPNPFGALFDTLKGNWPDFKIIGEVYHGQHGAWQNSGVDITYAKYVYDWIVKGENGGWQEFINYIFRRGYHRDANLQYMLRSYYFLEDHDQRVRIIRALAKRLYGINRLEEEAKHLGRALTEEEEWNRIQPHISQAVDWSKLLAVAIATIPGVPMIYAGQEKGRARHSSSADWVPPANFLDQKTETKIDELPAFYRRVFQATQDAPYRHGGLPEGIPVHGGNADTVAFVRRYQEEKGDAKAAVVLLNHSPHRITVSLDRSLIGQGWEEVTLDPWGFDHKILDDLTPPARSELRSLEEEKAYFQKGEIPVRAIQQSKSVKEGISVILQDYTELLRDQIERRTGGEKKEAARAILGHLEDLRERKRVSFIPGILWEDAYFLGRTEKDFLWIAQGLISKDYELGMMTLFRLATLSWLQSQNKKPAEQEKFLEGFFEFVFQDEGDAHFQTLHRRYTGLENKEMIETVLATMTHFYPDGLYFKTEFLFESWLEAYLRNERFSPVEEAGYLIKKIVANEEDVEKLSAYAAQTPQGEFAKKAYFGLILPMLAFSYYRSHFLKEMKEYIGQREEEVNRTVRTVVEGIYAKPPLTTQDLTRVINQIAEQLEGGKKAASKAIYETAIRMTLGNFKTKKKEELLPEIKNHIYHNFELLRSLDYYFPLHQERHLSLPEEPSVEVFKKYGEKMAALKLKVLISPEHERVQQLLKDYLEILNKSSKVSEMNMFSVPGLGPVSTSRYREWIQEFSGRLLDMEDPQSPTGRTMWSTYFSTHSTIAWGSLSRAARIHDVTPFLTVYDMAASPITELLQSIKAWPDTYTREGKKLTYQRFPQVIWSDIYNWTAPENHLVSVSTFHYPTRDFLRVLLQIRQHLEPAVYQNKPGYEAFAPGGIDLAPVVQRIMDFNLQLDTHFWTAVHDYYEASNPGLDWTEVYLAQDLQGEEEEAHKIRNYHLWHYSLFTAPRGVFEWLASRLHTSNRRLTAEEARDLLDVIYALYWSGISRAERSGFLHFLYQKFIEHIEFYPDGVKVRNLEAFKTFLTEWQKPEYYQNISTGFKKWEQDFYEKYPNARVEIQKDSEPVLPLKPVPSEPKKPPFALIRLIPENEKDVPNPFFSDEEIPLDDFLRIERHPAWKGIAAEDKSIIAELVYQNGGVDIPGQPFRYLFEGPAEGARLWAMLIAENVETNGRKQFLDYFSLTDRGEGGILYVHQPREEAVQTQGLRGKTIRKRENMQPFPWQKVPDLKKIEVRELKPGEFMSKDGFYRISVNEDLAVMNWVLAGSEKIYASLPSKAESVLVQVKGSKLLIYAADAGRYLGTIERTSQGDLRNESAEDEVRLRPAAHALVKQYDFQSLREYAFAQKIAEKAAPLLEAGIGYDKIDFRDFREGVYAQIEDKTLVLSRVWLKSETVQTKEGFKTVEDVVRALFEEKDARYQMKKALETLQKFWEGADLYDRAKPVPDLPSTDYTGESYTKAVQYRNRILAARKIMAAYDPASFQKVVKQYLKTLLETTAPSEFLMITRRTTYQSYASYLSEQSRVSEGVGFVTPRNFAFKTQGLEFKNSSGEDATPYLFFLVPNSSGKNPLRIFDRETGEELTSKHADILNLYEAKARWIAKFKWENGSLDVLTEMLDAYLSGLEGDASMLPAAQMEAIQQLDFISDLLDSHMAEEVNLLFVRLIFERLKTEARNSSGALKMKTAFSRTFKKKHDDVSNLHLVLDDLGFAVLPSEEFLNEVLIPALAPGKLHSSNSFGSADYFLNLSDDLQNIQTQIKLVLEKDPKAVSADLSRWINTALAREYRLLYAIEIDSIHRYFIRRELEVIHARAEAQHQKEKEEAELKKVPMTGAEKKANTARISFLGGAPRKIETRDRGNLWPGVGGSSSLWRYKKTSFVIDAGSYIDSVNSVPSYSKWIQEMPRAVFLTHTHTDHIGSVISLIKHLETLQKSGQRLPFFYVTKETHLLLEKALKDIAQDMRRNDREMRRNAVVAGQEAARTHHVRITPEQAEAFMDLVIPLEANQWYFMQEGEEQIKFRLRPSGHLFGAANLDIATPHARTFGFGDVSKHNQGSFVPGLADWTKEDGPVDTLVWEGTYGMRERTNEDAEEEKLVRAALDSLSKGGKVVIGGFANGRAPREMDIILKYLFRSESLIPAEERNKIKELRAQHRKFLDRVRILIDGRAAGYVEMVQKDLAESGGHVEILSGTRDEQKFRRKQLRDSKEPLIVIASSGNFSYGASRWWAEQLIGPQFKEHEDREEDKAAEARALEWLRKTYGNNLIVTAGYADPVEASSRLRETPQGAFFSFAPGAPSYEVYARILSAGLAGHISGAESIEFFKQVKQQGGLQRIFLVHGDRKNLEDLKTAVEKTPELKDVKVIIARTGLANQSTAASFRLTRQEWEAYKAVYEGIEAEALPEKQVDIPAVLKAIHKQRYVTPRFKTQPPAPAPPAPAPRTELPAPPLKIAEVPAAVEPPAPSIEVSTSAAEEAQPKKLTEAEKETAFKKLIKRLRESKSLSNVLRSKKTPLITELELRYLLEEIEKGAKSIQDPKRGNYAISGESARIIRERVTGIKLHKPEEEKKRKRSEVRTYQAFANHLAFGSAADQVQAEDLARLVSASRWENIETGFRKESAKPVYANLYAVREWIGTVGTAVDTSAYRQALESTTSGSRSFYVVLTREDLKQEFKLFLEAVLLIAAPGNHITLAVEDRKSAGKITSELNRLFRRQSKAGLSSLHEKISVEFVTPALLQNKVQEAGHLSGRLEVVASQENASLLLHNADTMKQVERIVVSDAVLAGGRPVEIQDGLLMKARLLVEAALTSKSTNALLAAGANPQLFYADQSLAANISSFLTSLIAAEQKILAAA